MLTLAFSLFFTEPFPLDMPRASSFLIQRGEESRLEDRYDKTDLWVTETVSGRWVDEDGRTFVLSELDYEPPAVGQNEVITRGAYVGQRVGMKRKRANSDFPKAFRQAIALLAPCPLVEEKPRPARQLPRGYAAVDYWHHPTNETMIVCAFRLERSDRWHLATWALTETDDYAECLETFEEEFLEEEFKAFWKRREALRDSPRETKPKKRETQPTERELLRADARHSVAAYDNWRFTDAEEFAVLDDLADRGAIEALTNEFATMRAKYAAALPTGVNGSNVLCVARVYATRNEYLDALEVDGYTNMAWSAAYWSAQRRELVAHLPERGEKELLKTIRHEAFHQYLSYATAMVPTSPWLNEGYAQYFEDEESEEWEIGTEVDDEAIGRMATMIPAVLLMDYQKFYEGTDLDRRLKYRLAWSIARFLEKGADKVRFQPFAQLKQEYFKELLKTCDMHVATAAVLGDEDKRKLFVAEWKKFWKKR